MNNMAYLLSMIRATPSPFTRMMVLKSVVLLSISKQFSVAYAPADGGI